MVPCACRQPVDVASVQPDRKVDVAPIQPDRKPVDLASIQRGPDGFISWEDAERVLLHPDVKHVTQFHSKVVDIYMKNGDRYKTMQRRIDAAWHIIENNGFKNRISYETE